MVWDAFDSGDGVRGVRCLVTATSDPPLERFLRPGQWFDLTKRTLSSTTTSATSFHLHIVRLSLSQVVMALLTASQGLLYYSFTTAMFATRVLATTPRILVVKRTLATFPSASSSASSTGPRLSTTNPVSVVTGHHDSPSSSESTLHHTSYSNTPSEQASKKPFMVDGSVAGGFGGIPMGAFAVSTPFEQH